MKTSKNPPDALKSAKRALLWSYLALIFAILSAIWSIYELFDHIREKF